MMEPHEFKWGWDAQKKRTHHWPSSQHARRTHRNDFAKLIGRQVSVRDGDVMGHGTYLPEERTDKGDIVGPPTVLLRATYNAEIPLDVIHHFENIYPATEVRRGHKHEHPPTHHEAKLEWTAPRSAADWAKENWGCRVEGPVGRESREPLLTSSHGVIDGTRQGAAAPTFWHTAGADLDGAMVAVFIPEEVGKKIQVDGGEPLDLMHITLCYFEDKAADRDDWDKALDVVEDVIKKHGPLEGKIGGYGVFSQEKGDVLWASPDVPGLAELRHELKEALELEGFDTNEEHGWTPHITLKYDWDGDFPEMDEPIDVVFEEVTLARGEDKQHKKLPKVAASMGNWTDMTQIAWEFIQGQEFVMRDLFKICEAVGGDFDKIHSDDHIFDSLIETIMTDPGLKQHLEEYTNTKNERMRGIRQTEFYMPSYEEWHDILEGIADSATDPRGGVFLGFGDFDFQPGDTTTIQNIMTPDSSPGDTTIPEDWHMAGTASWDCPECHMPVSLVNGWKCPNCGHDANEAAEQEMTDAENDPWVQVMYGHIDDLLKRVPDVEGIDGYITGGFSGKDAWWEGWSPSLERRFIVTPDGEVDPDEWDAKWEAESKPANTIIWDKDVGDVNEMTDWPTLPEEPDGA